MEMYKSKFEKNTRLEEGVVKVDKKIFAKEGLIRIDDIIYSKGNFKAFKKIFEPEEYSEEWFKEAEKVFDNLKMVDARASVSIPPGYKYALPELYDNSSFYLFFHNISNLDDIVSFDF